jgi:amino acid transporter
VIAIASMLIAWWLAYRDMKLSGWLMLGLEAAAVIGILTLCICILFRVHPTAADLTASFRPSLKFGGWTGLGYGMVYSILCFAGFEGAATLGEETINPRRNIPIALIGTVLFSGVFFIFVAYCEIAGFGSAGIRDLASSQAPLNDLALRYTSPALAIGLDLAAATSCFCGVLGCLAAAGRVLFALGRAGLSPALIGVGSAEVLEAWRARQQSWSAICTAGPLLLLWVLYRNIYPAPDFPNNLWPYFALAWMAGAWALIRMRPAVAKAALPDYP